MGHAPRAAVVALGTRGDVQPLAILASALEQQGWVVGIVTHACHAGWLAEAGGGVQLRALNEPPARRWADAGQVTTWHAQRLGAYLAS